MSEPVYKRSEKALVADVGDDIVALNIERGFTYGMTGVTAEVWQLLSQPRDLTNLCDELLNRYEVDAKTCREEVSQLLDEMTAEGLLELTAPAAKMGNV
jgi:hypothetical protein